MIKILVFLFILILSVLGSKQDSLSDLDKDGVKKSDSLKHPCSAQLSPNVLNEKLQNKVSELVGQQFANEEKKKEKISITLDCLVKTLEETATEIVSETDTEGNGNSRRSPDVQYLIKTKDNFRDSTTNKNRKKVNEEPTIHIDISEKCTKYKPKLMKKNLNSSRRFNIADNISDTDNSSVYIDSERNSYLTRELDLNPNNNQTKIPKEGDQDLSTQKVISGTLTNSGEPNQILSKEVTYNRSTQKYILSTPLHDEKNPNHSKKVSNKTSNKKYDLLFTPTDNINKESFVLLDFTNKKISDKPSAIKYDIESIITNKTYEIPIQLHDYNKVSDKLSTNKNYEKSYTPVYDNLLLNRRLGNIAASDKAPEKYDLHLLQKNKATTKDYDKDNSYKKDTDKPLTKKYKQTSTSNNIYNRHPGKKAAGDLKLLESHNQDLIHKEDSNKHLNSKYEPTSTLSDAILKDLVLYYDYDNKALSHKNIKVFKEDYQDLTHNLDSDKLSTYKYEQISTPYDVIVKDLLLDHDIGNKAADDNDMKPFLEHHQDLTHKTYIDKHSANKYEGNSASRDKFFKELLLHQDLGNDALSNKNNKMSKKHYQDLTHKINGDIIYTYKNEQTTTPYHDTYQEVTRGDKFSFDKYKQTSTPDDVNETDLLLYDNLSSKPASENFIKKYYLKSIAKISQERNENLSKKEADEKSSFEKYDSSSIPKDDIYMNPFLLHYVGDKELQDKDDSDKFDLESILKNIFQEHFQNFSYRRDGDKLSITKSGQSNAINHNIHRNLYSYPDLFAKEITDKQSNNNHLTLNNEVSKEHKQQLAHEEFRDLYASKFNKTQKEMLKTTIDITEPPLVEPTTGYSIKDLFKSRAMLLESTRVCYACSSMSDNSCRYPGRSTTVKYCRKGHTACLTKTFKTDESEFRVIRDCGVTCDGTWPVLDAKYKSCSICNEDMCNDHLVDINSGHTNSFNLMYFVSITVIIKFIF